MLMRKQIRLVVGLALLISGASVAMVHATCSPDVQTCSSGYGVNEVFFGSGGELNACSSGSTGYCSKQSAGELTVGNTKGTDYQAQAGFNTDRYPSLTFIVNAADIDLGKLTPGTTAYTTTTFSVKSYLSSGYVVQTMGNPPTNGGHQLAPITTAAASNPSTEQFGINLVKNQTTCPTPAPFNFGADPAQNPGTTFGFGYAAAGYNTCGKFQYNATDAIAASNSSSGETDYTISYIFNTTSITPGGTYTMNQTLVATATY
jgi:hypothetical protein